MICQGRKCSIIKDKKKAAELDEGTHLLLWENDQFRDLWVDQYDIRNESDLREFHRPLRLINEAGGINSIADFALDEEEDIIEDLMVERYQDLLESREDDFEHLQTLDSSECRREETRNSPLMHDLSMTGTELYKSDRVEFWERPEPERYPVPPVWNIPADLKLPNTKKEFDVLVHTSKNVREKGTQFEIFLKVKQAHSTTLLFDFLNSDCELSPLYEYLKRLPLDVFMAGLRSQPLSDGTCDNDGDGITEGSGNAAADAADGHEEKNALSLLVENYIDDDDIADESSTDRVSTHMQGNDKETPEETPGASSECAPTATDNCLDAEQSFIESAVTAGSPEVEAPVGVTSVAEGVSDAEITEDIEVIPPGETDTQPMTDIDALSEFEAVPEKGTFSIPAVQSGPGDDVECCEDVDDDLLDEDCDEDRFWGRAHKAKKAALDRLQEVSQKKKKAERLRRAKLLAQRLQSESQECVDNEGPSTGGVDQAHAQPTASQINPIAEKGYKTRNDELDGCGKRKRRSRSNSDHSDGFHDNRTSTRTRDYSRSPSRSRSPSGSRRPHRGEEGASRRRSDSRDRCRAEQYSRRGWSRSRSRSRLRSRSRSRDTYDKIHAKEERDGRLSREHRAESRSRSDSRDRTHTTTSTIGGGGGGGSGGGSSGNTVSADKMRGILASWKQRVREELGFDDESERFAANFTDHAIKAGIPPTKLDSLSFQDKIKVALDVLARKAGDNS